MIKTYTKNKIAKILIEELKKSIFVKEESKTIIFNNIDTFNFEQIKSILKLVKLANKKEDFLIKKALENNPNFLKEINSLKIKTIKKNLKEQEKKNKEEDKKQLNKLDYELSKLKFFNIFKIKKEKFFLEKRIIFNSSETGPIQYLDNLSDKFKNEKKDFKNSLQTQIDITKTIIDSVINNTEDRYDNNFKIKFKNNVLKLLQSNIKEENIKEFTTNNGEFNGATDLIEYFNDTNMEIYKIIESYKGNKKTVKKNRYRNIASELDKKESVNFNETFKKQLDRMNIYSKENLAFLVRDIKTRNTRTGIEEKYKYDIKPELLSTLQSNIGNFDGDNKNQIISYKTANLEILKTIKRTNQNNPENKQKFNDFIDGKIKEVKQSIRSLKDEIDAVDSTMIVTYSGNFETNFENSVVNMKYMNKRIISTTIEEINSAILAKYNNKNYSIGKNSQKLTIKTNDDDEDSFFLLKIENNYDLYSIDASNKLKKIDINQSFSDDNGNVLKIDNSGNLNIVQKKSKEKKDDHVDIIVKQELGGFSNIDINYKENKITINGNEEYDNNEEYFYRMNNNNIEFYRDEVLTSTQLAEVKYTLEEIKNELKQGNQEETQEYTDTMALDDIKKLGYSIIGNKNDDVGKVQMNDLNGVVVNLGPHFEPIKNYNSVTFKIYPRGIMQSKNVIGRFFSNIYNAFSYDCEYTFSQDSVKYNGKEMKFDQVFNINQVRNDGDIKEVGVKNKSIKELKDIEKMINYINKQYGYEIQSIDFNRMIITGKDDQKNEHEHKMSWNDSKQKIDYKKL